MSRKFGLLSTVAGAALALALTTAASDAADIVGLITKTNTNPFFVKMKQGFEAKAKELGLTPQAYAGKFDGDNDGEVRAIEQLSPPAPRASCWCRATSTAIVPTVKKARKAGVLVITLDTPLDPDRTAADANFATDNFKAGELIGQWAKGTLGDKAKDAKIATLDLASNEPTVDYLRHNGFLDGFGITVKDQEALLDERQPADRRLRRDQGRDRRRPPGDGEHPAEGRQDRPRLRDQRAGRLRRLRRAEGGGQGEGRDHRRASTAAARASSGSRRASSARPRSSTRC